MNKRAKGKILEGLVSSVLNDIGLPMNHLCNDNSLVSKGKHYADHENEFMVIEDKNWSCVERGYVVDCNLVYKQILSRYQDPKKINVLVISDPIFTDSAKALLNYMKVKIISLNSDNIENDYAKHYKYLARSFTKILLQVDLYCHTIGSNGYNLIRRLKGGLKEVLGKSFREWMDREMIYLRDHLDCYEPYVRLKWEDLTEYDKMILGGEVCV